MFNVLKLQDTIKFEYISNTVIRRFDKIQIIIGINDYLYVFVSNRRRTVSEIYTG